MIKNGTWGTDEEIHAFAKLVKVDVYVYHTYGKKGLKWLRFASNVTTDKAIYLDNRNGNCVNKGHFELVLGV